MDRGALAGIWTASTGTRGTGPNRETGERLLFGFQTTDANAEVGAVPRKAMPVISADLAAMNERMTAPWPEAVALHRPAPDWALRVVAGGERTDRATM